MISALQKIKSCIDYGMHTPTQIAATIALDGHQDCIIDIRNKYKDRMKVLLDSFNKIGFDIKQPKASMFVWAEIPNQYKHLGSLEFCKQVLKEAKVAFSSGVGFGESGEGYVRIVLIENEKRIRQAARNMRQYFNVKQGC